MAAAPCRVRVPDVRERGEIVELDRDLTPPAAQGRIGPAMLALVAVVIATAVIALPRPGAHAADVSATAAPHAAETRSPAPAVAAALILQPTPRVSTASPSGGGAPVSLGAVPDAGTLYIQGNDDQIYRYDGPAGTLQAVSGRSTFVRGTSAGVVVIGRHGSADLLRWNGPMVLGICGEGTVVAIAANGACAFRENDGAISVRLPGERERRVVLPATWEGGGIAWDPQGRRLALVRSIPGAAFEERAHNALWLLEADGTLRELYRPPEAQAFVFGVAWSPDGRWLTASESPIISNSVAADGVPMLLIDPVTGHATNLGVARSAQWSPSGDLAIVRGPGRETWQNKRLIVRTPAGGERVIAVPDADHIQLAPAWAGTALAFVVGPAGPLSPDYMSGVGIGARYGAVLGSDGRRTEVRCPNGPLEGLRPSADGSSYVLLCRAPGKDPYPLSIWWWRLGADRPLPLVGGLTGDRLAGGFGFYGAQPSLFRLVAWSKAVAP